MANNIEEKELTIKWYMADDKIIKFEEIDETFDISDKVAEFDFEKAGIKNGSKVSVKIDRNQGDHGMVVFMTKSKGSSNSYSNKLTSSSGGEVKTVKAYGLKYNGSLLFTDNDKEWYSCDKSIGVDNIAQYKDQQVEISTRTTEKGKKVVTSIKVCQNKSSQSVSQPKNDYSNKNNVDIKQNSIEAQASVNHANVTVATLFAGKFDATSQDDGNIVKSLIKTLAKNNWEIIQELKNNN